MVEAPQNPDWNLPQKLISYPTVSNTVDTVSSLYNATKTYNKLTEMTVGAVERTAGTIYTPVSYIAKPIVNKLDPQLHAIDHYATGQLENLEKRAPIITEEPHAIHDAAKETLVSTINNSYAGKIVNSALQPVVNVADRLAPGGTTVATPMPAGEAQNGEQPEAVGAAEREVSLQQTMQRACSIGSRIQKQAVDKTVDQIHQMTKRSNEVLVSMNETIDLIQYAKALDNKTHASEYMNKFKGVFNDIIEDDSVNGEDQENKTTREQIEYKTLVVAKNLTKKLSVGFETLMHYSSSYLPTKVSTQLSLGRELITSMEQAFTEANSFKDLSSTFLASTKQNINVLTQTVKDVSFETLEYVATTRPISWVVPKNKLLSEIDRRRSTGSSESSYAPSDSLDEPLPSSNDLEEESDENDEEKTDQETEANK